MLFLLLFLLLCKVKHATALPCDVLGKVVRGMCLQAVCSSGVLRKQSQHRWCSMLLHMAGSQPGELTILLHSSLPLSFPLSHVSVNVCQFSCFFPSSAPAALVSIGLPCCLSQYLSVCLCLCFCMYLSVCECCPDAAHQSCRQSATATKG